MTTEETQECLRQTCWSSQATMDLNKGQAVGNVHADVEGANIQQLIWTDQVDSVFQTMQWTIDILQHCNATRNSSHIHICRTH